MSDAHDLPYPGPPKPPPMAGSEVFKFIWQAVSRIAVFGVGTVLVFTGDTDTQVTIGSGLMLAAAGIALAKGLR